MAKKRNELRLMDVSDALMEALTENGKKQVRKPNAEAKFFLENEYPIKNKNKKKCK